ncbi:MAG TPA: peptidoglycan-binding protein, partial [Polyangiaceae bacterium]|nr:peptidoglycan-binding protein [Polyangiaceae bacterium]
KGAVAIINPPTMTVNATLVDFDGLVQKLKSRWDKPRPGRRLPPGPGVAVLSLTESPEPLSLPCGTTIVSIQPRVVAARVVGMFFDTDKAFLLPSAIAGMRGMKQLNDENPDTTLLVVGHADTAGTSSHNDKLSLERAQSVAAFLTDDVDKWLPFYDSSVPESKRWGAKEDGSMLSALPDAAQLVSAPDPIRAFQQSRGLEVDGKAGPKTRRQLVTEYMALDQTSLPKGTKIVAHGCGENFLADETGDGVADAANRRAELFFFDKKLGIQPPPQGQNSGPNSTDYPEWKRRSEETQEFDASHRPFHIRLLDAADAPLVDVPWVIKHAEGAIAGRTTDDGRVEATLPASATEVTLSFADQSIQVTVVADDQFPPAQNVDGAVLRLTSLGYDPGVDDTSLTPQLSAALREFQADHQLPTNGLLDLATSAKLLEVYGS